MKKALAMILAAGMMLAMGRLRGRPHLFGQHTRFRQLLCTGRGYPHLFHKPQNGGSCLLGNSQGRRSCRRRRPWRRSNLERHV